MLVTILLIGTVLFGLILLAVGGVLLLKVSNKLPGILVIAAGLLFTVSPVMVFLALTVARTSTGV